MGRGDKKTKKGKIFKGSYGVARPRKSDSPISVTTKKKKETTKKKATAKKKVTAKKK